MKTRDLLQFVCLSLLSCVLLTGCSKDDGPSFSVPKGAVSFHAGNIETRSSDSGWQTVNVPLNGQEASSGQSTLPATSLRTRGIAVTGTDAPNGSFGVLAYQLPGGVWNSSTSTPSFMYNTQVTRSGNSGSYGFQYYPYKFWPDNASDLVKFFAYYPYKGNGIMLSPQTTAGYPTIAYSPSTTVADQVDLMYASSPAVNNRTSGNAVNLALSHALTRISFSVMNGGASTIKVQSIRLSGIRNKGTLSLDPSLSNPWTLSALSTDTTSYKISTTDGTLIPETNQVINTSSYQNVTGQSGYLMMLPQAVTTNNQAIVYYTDGGTSQMAILNLPASTWTKGASINYQLVLGKLPNCYIVSPSTTGFIIPIIKANTFWGTNGDGNTPANVIGSSDTWTASVIWQDVSGLVTLTTSSGTGAGGNIVLSTSSGTGNAVIGIKKSGVNGYLWSWHVWVTNYNPNTQNVSYNNLTWMDRNLGATSNTATSTSDTRSYGLYYQWGRKDPFRGQNYTAVTGNTTCNLTNSVQNPTTFYYAGVTNLDWYTNIRGKQNNTLWGPTKTIYDPCPAGWKVPVNGSWTGTTYTAATNGITYNGGFYPYNGYLIYNGMLYSGPMGEYWSASSSNNNFLYSNNLYFVSNNMISDNSDARVEGFSVRCVKE